LKSQIKIVKRKPDPIRADGEDELEIKPVEPSTREITIVVKKWIAELKERKSSHNSNFTPLEVIANQAS
jgi:hypothetical protein